MNEENTGAEAIISDEEAELDLNPTGTEDYDALAQKLKNAEMAKKQILARAKKAEEKLKTITPPPPQITKEEKPQPQDDSKLWEIAEMIQSGYTRADAEFIQKNGGTEALKDPNSYVAVALRTIQEQRRAELAASQTSSGSGQSELERKYTPEQLKNMSVEELRKILPHAEPS
jgi:hypothetical protein